MKTKKVEYRIITTQTIEKDDKTIRSESSEVVVFIDEPMEETQ